VRQWYLNWRDWKVGAVTTIQRIWRGGECRRRLKNLVAAAITAQKCRKGTLQRRSYLKLLVRRELATIIMQAHSRSVAVRRMVSRWTAAAVMIQARWRGAMARQHVKQAIARIVAENERKKREAEAAAEEAERVSFSFKENYKEEPIATDGYGLSRTLS
jgi:myosin heavy subunit